MDLAKDLHINEPISRDLTSLSKHTADEKKKSLSIRSEHASSKMLSFAAFHLGMGVN